MYKRPPLGWARDRIGVPRLKAASVAAALAAGMFTVSAADARQTTPGPCESVASLGTPNAAAVPAAVVRKAPPIATITLVTGDRVQLRQGAGGLTAAPALRPHSPGSGFVRLTWSGDQYMIPYEAVPFLGTLLDPRLFDVSYLYRAGLSDATATAIPVTAGGAAGGGLPGLRPGTSSADGTATIVKARAARFGSLLASLWRPGGASRSAATALRETGEIGPAPVAGMPLPAQLPIGIPAGSGSAAAAPAFRTVSFGFTGSNGKPAVAIGWMQNLDDARLSELVVTALDASSQFAWPPQPAAVSLPSGAYSPVFNVLTPRMGDPSKGIDAALVIRPQVMITSDTTVTMDARTAVPYRVNVTGGLANSARVDLLGVTRISTSGGACSGFGWNLFLDAATSPDQGVFSSLSATPISKVRLGGLDFDAATSIQTGFQANLPAGPEYDLDFPYQGQIPDSLRYSVPLARFTRVRQDVHTAPGGWPSGCPEPPNVSPDIFLRWGAVQTLGLGDLGAAEPGIRTDYWYSGDPRLDSWQPVFGGGDCVVRTGAAHALTPGGQISENWAAGPMVPSPAAPSAVSAQWPPFTLASGDPAVSYLPAGRQGNIGMLMLQPYGDSQPTHSGVQTFVNAPSAISFYRDGTLALSSSQTPTGVLTAYGLMLPMLARPGRYRLDWRQYRALDPASYTETDWAFRSGPADAAAQPARGEMCAPDPAQGCSFLPLLFVNYQLALNDLSQAQAGKPFKIAFAVSHQQGQRPPAGLSATVSASFDDGKTWTAPRAASSTGPGTFGLTISQPQLSATSGFASLRVTVRGHDGDSVTQTIIRAYALAG